MTNIVNTTSRIPAVAANIGFAVEPDFVKMTHGNLILTFADQTTAQLSTIDLTPEILSQALMHGLKQKLVDAAAIARSLEDGKSATVADKKEAVLKVLNRLMEGSWNVGREAGDNSGKGSILLLALQRMQPTRDAAELAEWVKARTDAERAALAKNAKLLPFIQTIQAERAATAAKKSGVDSDSLLDSLLG